MAEVRIKFLVPYIVKDFRARTPEAERYEEGQEVTVSEASALHFIGRQVAVMVVATPIQSMAVMEKPVALPHAPVAPSPEPQEPSPVPPVSPPMPMSSESIKPPETGRGRR